MRARAAAPRCSTVPPRIVAVVTPVAPGRVDHPAPAAGGASAALARPPTGVGPAAMSSAASADAVSAGDGGTGNKAPEPGPDGFEPERAAMGPNADPRRRMAAISAPDRRRFGSSVTPSPTL